MFQKYFDNIYVINLKSSEDRRASINHQCHKLGVKFELVEAINGKEEDVDYVKNEANSKYDGWTQGAAGLVYTTINIIKDAKAKGYKSILILEDDIIFKEFAFEKFKETWSCLPDEWELFHFAYQNFRRPRKLGKLYQLSGAWSCQMYAINESIYDEYLDWLELVDRPIDSITSNIFHKRGKSYAPRIPLIDTIPNWSTIRQMNINYGVAN